jgi:hypothetical protein
VTLKLSPVSSDGVCTGVLADELDLATELDDVAIGLVLCLGSGAVFLLLPPALPADFTLELVGCGSRGFETMDLPGG